MNLVLERVKASVIFAVVSGLLRAPSAVLTAVTRSAIELAPPRAVCIAARSVASSAPGAL